MKEPSQQESRPPAHASKGPDPVIAQVIDRASRGFARWEELVAQTGYCRHPVRLLGSVQQVDQETGELGPEIYSSIQEPDGVLFIACGNRRASVCPSCSETYQADAYHLVAAGLRGGKGVPASLANHPRLFVTFTAPSFGAIHARRLRGESVLSCHPRRSGRCPHGNQVSCRRRHAQTDVLVGQALCSECFDYRGQVLWNSAAPDLWRRTITYLPRALASQAGVTVKQIGKLVKVRYVKVAEFQARGAVHFHAVFRLDEATKDPGDLAAPPARFSAEVLEAAIRQAVRSVGVSVEGMHGGRAVWGNQIDIRKITAATQTTEEQVAFYVAKYSTKGAEAAGALAHPIESADELDNLQAPPLVATLIRTAWDLGLNAWAHQLGFGGHFCTKSLRYSTTLTRLRRARAEHAKELAHRRRRPEGAATDQAESLIGENPNVIGIGSWRFAGQGYANQGEEWLAASAYAGAQLKRAAARLEIYSGDKEP